MSPCMCIRSIEETTVLPARWQGFTESLVIRCMQYVDHAPQNASGRDRYATPISPQYPTVPLHFSLTYGQRGLPAPETKLFAGPRGRS